MASPIGLYGRFCLFRTFETILLTGFGYHLSLLTCEEVVVGCSLGCFTGFAVTKCWERMENVGGGGKLARRENWRGKLAWAFYCKKWKIRKSCQPTCVWDNWSEKVIPAKKKERNFGLPKRMGKFGYIFSVLASVPALANAYIENIYSACGSKG